MRRHGWLHYIGAVGLAVCVCLDLVLAGLTYGFWRLMGQDDDS